MQIFLCMLKVIRLCTLDHHNCVRWIPTHIQDMEILPAPVLKAEKHGHWKIRKTNNRFSTIPADQAHEQNNKAVRGPVGAVGLRTLQLSGNGWLQGLNSQGYWNSLKRTTYQKKKKKSPIVIIMKRDYLRREVSGSRSLVLVISEMGNPFLDDSDEILTLDTWTSCFSWREASWWSCCCLLAPYKQCCDIWRVCWSGLYSTYHETIKNLQGSWYSMGHTHPK